MVAALRSGRLTSGPEVERFEAEFASYVGAPEALAVSSCTAGLHVALVAAGIGPGDAVVTTPLTFAATAHAIVHSGARPLLADVEADTLGLCPRSVARLLDRHRGERIRALLPVHHAGHAVDLERLDALAHEHGLLVVEDAAHALPTSVPTPHGGATRVGGHRPGRPPALASFSFYANKNLTTGEGGMLTGPADVLARARELVYQGRGADVRGGPSWRRPVARVGFKYNLPDPAAALGRSQLRRLDERHARRRALAARYTEALRSVDGVLPPAVRPGHDHAWHLYVVRLPLDRLRVDRDRVAAELDAEGIATSVHFVPVHHQPAYAGRAGFEAERLPVCEREAPRLLSLPVHPGLTDEDVDRVVDTLDRVLRRLRR